MDAPTQPVDEEDFDPTPPSIEKVDIRITYQGELLVPLLVELRPRLAICFLVSGEEILLVGHSCQLEIFYNRSPVYHAEATVTRAEKKVEPGGFWIELRPESPFNLSERILAPETSEPPTPENFHPDPHQLPQFSRMEKIPERKSFAPEHSLQRLQWITKRGELPSAGLRGHHYDSQRLKGNIEHFIGAVQIPVGLAGPLLINGSRARGFFNIPIATTEGALVSSISRGAQVFSQSGGVNVTVLKQQMVRAPQFNFKTSAQAYKFTHWLAENFHRVKGVAEQFSRRAKLLKLVPYILGRTTHVRFIYTTGDAAGQNMCTVCTWGACKWISEEVLKNPFSGFQNFILEGNFAGDKKVNMYNFIHGRGISVIADGFIPRKILTRHLRVSPEELSNGMTQSLHGATATGQIGNTANFANVIAGIFTACGQDIACVHESSSGQLFWDASEEGFFISCRIPNLVIGTVGGGTALASQKECLRILGCYGSGGVARLAEIITAACLALDLSTCAALVEDTFAQAHDALGRNRPEMKDK